MLNNETGAGRVGVIVVAAGSGSTSGGTPCPRRSCPSRACPCSDTPCGGCWRARAWPRSSSSSRPPTAARPSGWPPRMPCARVARTTVTVTSGGAERGDSVAAGLRALRDRGRRRPRPRRRPVPHAGRRSSTGVIAAVAAGAVAVVPGMPVVDTIKQVDDDGFVVATPERSALRAVQTPQGFRRDVLERAHAASSDGDGRRRPGRAARRAGARRRG